MKAILMTATGTPEVLKYQDIPEPQLTESSQIKIKLEAAGINPVDTKIRRNGIMYPLPLPAVLGCDGAGTVVEIGSEAKRFRPGDKVWFCHGGLGREQGNYAEYNVLDERWADPMPSNLNFTQAAALPLILITAWSGMFFRGGLSSGETVLIHAGAGGVGHVAIQLAKLAGARVITTVGSEDKAAFVKSLGADLVINYRQEIIPEKVLEFTQGRGADLVFDTVGGEVLKQSVNITAHFGRLVTLLSMVDIDFNEARLRNLLIGFELMLTPMLRDIPDARMKHIDILANCRQYLEAGTLQPYVSRIFPLSEAQAAHSHIETGHTQGKIVLKMRD